MATRMTNTIGGMFLILGLIWTVAWAAVYLVAAYRNYKGTLNPNGALVYILIVFIRALCWPFQRWLK